MRKKKGLVIIIIEIHVTRYVGILKNIPRIYVWDCLKKKCYENKSLPMMKYCLILVCSPNSLCRKLQLRNIVDLFLIPWTVFLLNFLLVSLVWWGPIKLQIDVIPWFARGGQVKEPNGFGICLQIFSPQVNFARAMASLITAKIKIDYKQQFWEGFSDR